MATTKRLKYLIVFILSGLSTAGNAAVIYDLQLSAYTKVNSVSDSDSSSTTNVSSTQGTYYSNGIDNYVTSAGDLSGNFALEAQGVGTYNNVSIFTQKYTLSSDQDSSFNFDFNIKEGSLSAFCDTGATALGDLGSLPPGLETCVYGDYALAGYNVTVSFGLEGSSLTDLWSSSAEIKANTGSGSSAHSGTDLTGLSINTTNHSVSWVDDSYSVSLGNLLTGNNYELIYSVESYVKGSFHPCSGASCDTYVENNHSTSTFSDPTNFSAQNTAGISPFQSPSTVPEPGIITLLSTGLIGLFYSRRRKFRQLKKGNEEVYY